MMRHAMQQVDKDFYKIIHSDGIDKFNKYINAAYADGYIIPKNQSKIQIKAGTNTFRYIIIMELRPKINEKDKFE